MPEIIMDSPDLPMPWHRETWQQLLSQVKTDRLAHAYLLSGVPGSGRRHFADAFTAFLLCNSVAKAEQACGHCQQCLLYFSGNHPDVFEVIPEENSDVIKIEQIRRLSGQVLQTSSQSGAHKMIIIHPAEALGLASANSLLKILEEPPGKTLFLLISDSSKQLLPTIRSRCQPLALHSPDATQMQAWMAQKTAADQDSIAKAIALAPHSPRLALQYLESGLPHWQELFLDYLTELSAGRESVCTVARFCEKQSYAHAITVITDICVQQMRALAVAKQTVEGQPAENQTGEDSRRNLDRAIQWTALYQSAIQLARQLGSTANPNSALSFEQLLIHWQEVTDPACKSSLRPHY
jgi:DNA polymerase III subunit delta'